VHPLHRIGDLLRRGTDAAWGRFTNSRDDPSRVIVTISRQVFI